MRLQNLYSVQIIICLFQDWMYNFFRMCMCVRTDCVNTFATVSPVPRTARLSVRTTQLQKIMLI